jgi:hypothetical protein
MTGRDTPQARIGRKSRQRHDKIGEKLREMYEEIASEPTPDSFLQLLEDADAAERSQSGENSE